MLNWQPWDSSLQPFAVGGAAAKKCSFKLVDMVGVGSVA